MIAGMTYYEIASWFLLYSFIGWCTEVIFHAVCVGKIINRGFMCGPVCPIYGFGVILVFGLVKGLAPSLPTERSLSSLVIIFVGGSLLATLVELIGGWSLAHFFHARWWDYSDEPFNLGGYICLRFSLLWGVGAIFIVKVVQPAMEAAESIQIPEKYGWPLLGVLYAVFAVDFVVTVMIVAGMNRKLEELDAIEKKLRVVSDGLSSRIGSDSMRMQKTVVETKDKAQQMSAEVAAALEEKAEATVSALSEKRDATVSALAEKRDATVSAFTEKRDATVSALAEKRDATVSALVEKKEAAAEALSDGKKAAAAAFRESRASAGAGLRRSREQMEKQYQALEERAASLRKLFRKAGLFSYRRLLRAFPQLRHLRYQAALDDLRADMDVQDETTMHGR